MNLRLPAKLGNVDTSRFRAAFDVGDDLLLIHATAISMIAT